MPNSIAQHRTSGEEWPTASVYFQRFADTITERRGELGWQGLARMPAHGGSVVDEREVPGAVIRKRHEVSPHDSALGRTAHPDVTYVDAGNIARQRGRTSEHIASDRSRIPLLGQSPPHLADDPAGGVPENAVELGYRDGVVLHPGQVPLGAPHHRSRTEHRPACAFLLPLVVEFLTQRLDRRRRQHSLRLSQLHRKLEVVGHVVGQRLEVDSERDVHPTVTDPRAVAHTSSGDRAREDRRTLVPVSAHEISLSLTDHGRSAAPALNPPQVR